MLYPIALRALNFIVSGLPTHYRGKVKSSIETEIKLAAPNAAEGRRLLLAHGFFELSPRTFERNLVLDDDTRSIRASDRLLRMRQAGELVTCTYKGPAIAGSIHKQREEREFTATNFDDVLNVFAGLGYRSCFRYDKFRTEFAVPNQPGLATLDETPIGTYFELEGQADWIDRTANALGFDATKYITVSYARLYLDWCSMNAITPGDFVF